MKLNMTTGPAVTLSLSVDDWGDQVINVTRMGESYGGRIAWINPTGKLYRCRLSALEWFGFPTQDNGRIQETTTP